MGASRQKLARILAALGAIFALPVVVHGQVGITSGRTEIALVAHVPARGAIEGVSVERETARRGGLREASVTVRVSANTGYRLLVKSAGNQTSRIWVKAVTGEFQELSAGGSVTVARDTHCAGLCEREVQYRIESTGALNSLPLRYEMALSAQL